MKQSFVRRFTAVGSSVALSVALCSGCSDDGESPAGNGAADAGTSSADESASSDGESTGGETQESSPSGADAGGQTTAETVDEGTTDAVSSSDAASEPTTESDAGEPITESPDADTAPVDGDFEVIPLPEEAMAGFPLAFNDEGQVLIGAAVDSLAYDRLFTVEDGTATAVDTGDVDVDLNGLNVGACINNLGQIGFNGKRDGIHQVRFFDGEDWRDVSFGDADGLGLVLRGCNDSGTVVAGTATGTAVWSWTDGAPAPIVEGVFAVNLLGINQNGEVALSNQYYDGETVADYPSSLLASAGPSEDGHVAGVVLDLANGTNFISTWQLADAEATALANVPDVDGITAVAVSDLGVVLAASVALRDIRVWLVNDDGARELGAEGYTIERVVDVNASGEILVAASADDETPIAGLILHP